MSVNFFFKINEIFVINKLKICEKKTRREKKKRRIKKVSRGKRCGNNNLKGEMVVMEALTTIVTVTSTEREEPKATIIVKEIVMTNSAMMIRGERIRRLN